MREEKLSKTFRRPLIAILLTWIIFCAGVYLSFSETWRYSMRGFSDRVASLAYLMALLIGIHWNCWRKFRGHISLWVSMVIVTLAFAAAGYFIEQGTYMDADDPEKSMGGLIFAVAIIVGLTVTVISSLSILGNRFLNANDAERPST